MFKINQDSRRSEKKAYTGRVWAEFGQSNYVIHCLREIWDTITEGATFFDYGIGEPGKGLALYPVTPMGKKVGNKPRQKDETVPSPYHTFRIPKEAAEKALSGWPKMGARELTFDVDDVENLSGGIVPGLVLTGWAK